MIIGYFFYAKKRKIQYLRWSPNCEKDQQFFLIHLTFHSIRINKITYQIEKKVDDVLCILTLLPVKIFHKLINCIHKYQIQPGNKLKSVSLIQDHHKALQICLCQTKKKNEMNAKCTLTDALVYRSK